MPGHLKLRLGVDSSTRSSTAVLSTLNAENYAYALLLEADTLDSSLQELSRLSP